MLTNRQINTFASLYENEKFFLSTCFKNIDQEIVFIDDTPYKNWFLNHNNNVHQEEYEIHFENLMFNLINMHILDYVFVEDQYTTVISAPYKETVARIMI